MYRVKFYKGDYPARQLAANADGCVAYVEHHFNSNDGAAGTYAVVIVGSNASSTSKNWGRWYARSVAGAFGIGLGGDEGIVVGGYKGRGDGNLRLTRMPAILVEPLFADNPTHAAWIRSDAGRERLARILADSVQRCFPAGGLVGLSVGHKYKTSSPSDRGVPVYGGGTEADYAEEVLILAATFLQTMTALTARPLRVQIGNREVWRYEADPDAIVRWDATRGILLIDEPGVIEGSSTVAPAVERRRTRRTAKAGGPTRHVTKRVRRGRGAKKKAVRAKPTRR